MSRWIEVAALAEIPPGSMREVIAGDRVVALANVEGQIFAIDGVCPHQGGPLGEGQLEGPIVTCPWHGWQFDVRSGQHCLSRTIIQPQFAVRVEGDSIFVDLGQEGG